MITWFWQNGPFAQAQVMVTVQTYLVELRAAHAEAERLLHRLSAIGHGPCPRAPRAAGLLGVWVMQVISRWSRAARSSSPDDQAVSAQQARVHLVP